ELRLVQSDVDTEREDRVDEAMRVTDADKPGAREAAYLERVVRNHVDVLDELDARQTPGQLGMQLAQLPAQEGLLALALIEEVPRGDHDADAHDLRVERNRPCPVELPFVEDDRVTRHGLAP